MGDLVKIGVKTALVATITVAIIAVFATIQIPTPDFTSVFAALGKALALANYWIPAFGVFWTIALGLMALRVAIWLFRFAMIAVRWIMKVNE